MVDFDLQQRRRSLPVVAGAILGALALLTVAGIMLLGRGRAGQPMQTMSLPIPAGIQQRTMPDGTILVLEKVTAGGPHKYNWERRQAFPVASGSLDSTITAMGPRNAIVLWFTRFDPQTGRSLDFDWWLYGAAVDDDGHEFDDATAGQSDDVTTGRTCFAADSQATQNAGVRPYRADRSHDWELIVAYTGVRPFRHKGSSFKYRMYDTQRALVAEFDVPHTVPATLPIWAPQQLPQGKYVQNTYIGLAELRAGPLRPEQQPGRGPRYAVKPTIQVSEDNQMGATAPNECEFEDPFGNVWPHDNCRLYPQEPVWKVRFRVWPGGVGAGLVNWSARDLGVFALPEANTTSSDRRPGGGAGIQMELLGLGGVGSVVYTESAGRGTASTEAGGELDGIPYTIRMERRDGKLTTTVSSTEFPIRSGWNAGMEN